MLCCGRKNAYSIYKYYSMGMVHGRRPPRSGLKKEKKRNSYTDSRKEQREAVEASILLVRMTFSLLDLVLGCGWPDLPEY